MKVEITTKNKKLVYRGDPAVLFQKLADNSVVILGIKITDSNPKIIFDLAKALKSNGSIKSVNLSFNEIGVNEIKELTAAISINNIVETLDLSTDNLDIEGAREIANFLLKKNNSIKELRLFLNRIEKEGAIAIAGALKTNSNLVKLTLGANNIQKEGAKAIGDSLKQNKVLISLNLSSNYICDDGAIAVATALKDNSTLRSIDLSQNNIGSRGATELAKALKENTNLVSINLSDNPIKIIDINEIIDSIKLSKIIEVKLDNVIVPNALSAQIDRICKLNKKSIIKEFGFINLPHEDFSKFFLIHHEIKSYMKLLKITKEQIAQMVLDESLLELTAQDKREEYVIELALNSLNNTVISEETCEVTCKEILDFIKTHKYAREKAKFLVSDNDNFTKEFIEAINIIPNEAVYKLGVIGTIHEYDFELIETDTGNYFHSLV